MRFTRLFSRPTYTAALACLLLSGLAACSTVTPSQTTSEGDTAEITTDSPREIDADASIDRDITVSNLQGDEDADYDEHDGRRGADLPYGPNARELATTLTVAVDEDVLFNPGETSTVISDGVVRGDRNVHRFSAESGQQIFLSISALEDNAGFQVIAPSGLGLTEEVTYEDSFVLPETGEYIVVVGGTRGNASYDLSLEINERDFHGEEGGSYDEHGGRPGADLPYGPNASELTDGTITVRNLEISFDPGDSSTVVSDAVVRGERDVYRLEAQSGQQMTLLISSVEDNAVFQVLDPSGIGLTREVTSDSFVLPEAGEYTVVVGGTRGNASYDLEIGIE